MEAAEMNTEQMIQCALEENFTAAAVVDTSEIVFTQEFLQIQAASGTRTQRQKHLK